MTGTETLYGWNAVLESLEAGTRSFGRIFIARDRRDKRRRRLESLARERGVPVIDRSAKQLDELAGGGNHQGVVAQVAPVAYRDLHDVLDAEEGVPLLVLLDGVEDPHNLGAVIRSAAAAGATAVVIPERRSAGLTGAVAKAAAGGLDRVPVVREKNLAQTLETLKDLDIWSVGMDAEAERSWNEVDWTLPSAIVLGGEAKGLRRLVRERCDLLARLPLEGGMESLNVSVTAGIVLYEAVRQRRAT